MSDKTYDLISEIIDYEVGDSTPERIIALFQHLVDTGLVWNLQGSYGRMAQSLIEAGYVTMKSTEES